MPVSATRITKWSLRFAETLPDDNYEIRIGAPLRNLLGEAFGQTQTVRSTLTWVPKSSVSCRNPWCANAAAHLEHRRNQIVVYFNNDDLNTTAAQTPSSTS